MFGTAQELFCYSTVLQTRYTWVIFFHYATQYQGCSLMIVLIIELTGFYTYPRRFSFERSVSDSTITIVQPAVAIHGRFGSKYCATVRPAVAIHGRFGSKCCVTVRPAVARDGRFGSKYCVTVRPAVTIHDRFGSKYCVTVRPAVTIHDRFGALPYTNFTTVVTTLLPRSSIDSVTECSCAHVWTEDDVVGGLGMPNFLMATDLTGLLTRLAVSFFVCLRRSKSLVLFFIRRSRI